MSSGKRSWITILFVALIAFVASGCAHSRKKGSSGSSSAKSEKSDPAAEKAVQETNEDERLAPLIQREMNALFFKDKALNPGGLNAFSADRVQHLEEAMKTSDFKAIQYYLENRDYFDRVEDPGGGYRILSNAKRLTPFRWTKVGRRKLFDMDTVRVRESVANPCFSAIEDCGEYASDAMENLELIKAWAKKYSEEDFASDRQKFLHEYSAALKRYEMRILKGVPPKARGTAKGAKEATDLIESQRKTVEDLI